MRLNKYVALASGLSRRAADDAIAKGQISVNQQIASLGQHIDPVDDTVMLDGKVLEAPASPTTIMLNKPVGYVCSRDGQGSKTIYDLLPADMHRLKPVGRLDKYSSGLLLMTNDGQLAYQLTHPKFEKIKKYNVAINKDLTEEDHKKITATGVQLEDGISKFMLGKVNNQYKDWKVSMSEGKNRQIRRTFEALGYSVVKLHRTQFGDYSLAMLKPGSYIDA